MSEFVLLMKTYTACPQQKGQQIQQYEKILSRFCQISRFCIDIKQQYLPGYYMFGQVRSQNIEKSIKKLLPKFFTHNRAFSKKKKKKEGSMGHIV